MKGLVLESSTTSAKAMLYDTSTGRITVRTAPYCFADASAAEQNADGIFAQTAALGKSLCENDTVDIISLSGTLHSVMLTDRDKTPVTPVFQWPYTGAGAICGKLRRDAAFVDWFYHRTGCMVSAIYPAFKLMLLAQQGYSIKNHLVMGQGTYSFYRLTGTYAKTASMASGTGLLNTRLWDYDDDILSCVGIGRESLPPLIRFSDTRPLSAKGAAALGLQAGIPVVPPGPDGGLNQLGAGATKPGIMTFSAGTSGALRLTADHPVLADDRSLWCYISPVSWLIGAATSGCCNCVDWAKQRFFGDTVPYAEIEKGLQDCPDDTPVFLPFLFGERCPGWNDAREASFCGVNARHSAYSLYHSVLEGTLFNLFQCYKKLCAVSGQPQEIRLSGGILHSAYWTQMAADIFGVTLLTADMPHASLAGAAILAMTTFDSTDTLFTCQTAKAAHPRPGMTARYAEKFSRYLRAYENQTALL